MRIRVLMLIFATAILFGCSTLKSINIYPPSKDIELGKEVMQQLKSNPRDYPVLNNSNLKSYLTGIMNEILKSKHIQYKKKFNYQIEIINRDDIVNAFCAPGGYIYVYTGLLKFVDNEATLAGIIAHEIAHAELRHATKRMTQSYGMNILMDAAKKQTGEEKYTEMAGNLFSGLGLLKNSRDNELEADEMAFKYLQSTKWYPAGIKYFFDKVMGQATASSNMLDELLSTHPLSADRVDAMTELMKNAGLSPPKEDNLKKRDYKKVIAVLEKK